MNDYFSIFGLDYKADKEALDRAFAYLSQAFKASNFPVESKLEKQAAKALSKVEEAYAVLSSNQKKAAYIKEFQAQGELYGPEQLRPLIGHICAAAGNITYEQLIEAVASQSTINLPLGQILQQKNLISQTELEGMLMGQKLYGVPHRELDPLARRLLALEIVDLDMVRIALIDQRSSIINLHILLSSRGWVEPQIIRILTEQPQ